MKKYINPVIKELSLNVEDVIQTSGSILEGASVGEISFDELKNAMYDTNSVSLMK